MQTKLFPFAAALSAGIALSVVATPASAQKKAIEVQVELSGSKHVTVDGTIARVSTAAATIADVKAFPPNELLITGKRTGATNAVVWTRTGVQIVAIKVIYPAAMIRKAVVEGIPGASKISVTTAGAALVLGGEVPTPADVIRAEKLAKGIAAGVAGGDVPVINALKVPGDQQVQLEVAFAEVSRTALRAIGMNFWSKRIGSDGKGFAGGLTNPSTSLSGLSPTLSTTPDLGKLNTGPTGFDADTGAPLSDSVPLVGNPISGAFGAIFSSTLGNFPFSAALSLLSNKGYARTMAEPTLVAMSGKSAKFLAGGEFPIPLPQSLGQIAVEYRKFGIQLAFTPTVIGKNIQLKLAMTVSDINQSLGVKLASTTVPGLTERHSQTTVRLRDKQSFVIAGLLSDRVRSNVDKVPWLGDIPVLGTLFRSSSYQREETELLVVVTARLVRPMNKRPTLPGEHTTSDPGDLELFLLGDHESVDEGKKSPRNKAKARRKASMPVGAVGFKR